MSSVGTSSRAFCIVTLTNGLLSWIVQDLSLSTQALKQPEKFFFLLCVCINYFYYYIVTFRKNNVSLVSHLHWLINQGTSCSLLKVCFFAWKTENADAIWMNNGVYYHILPESQTFQLSSSSYSCDQIILLLEAPWQSLWFNSLDAYPSFPLRVAQRPFSPSVFLTIITTQGSLVWKVMVGPVSFNNYRWIWTCLFQVNSNSLTLHHTDSQWLATLHTRTSIEEAFTRVFNTQKIPLTPQVKKFAWLNE